MQAQPESHTVEIAVSVTSHPDPGAVKELAAELCRQLEARGAQPWHIAWTQKSSQLVGTHEWVTRSATVLGSPVAEGELDQRNRNSEAPGAS